MLETPNLILRRFTVDDAAFIFELLNTPTWKQFIGERNINTLQDAVNYINNVLANYYDKYGYGPWLVMLKEGNKPIGMCGLFKRDYLELPDIGFAFLPEFAGKGLAYESCTAVLGTLRKKFALNSIFATTTDANIRSQSLLEKCGFIYQENITTTEGDHLRLYRVVLP
ncbi:GNAT family N-acetyltransferase [Mucilaginibacter gynuensis]|uniref:GNAT family N-acetyltransferase n=1 Tax=Mucilaginibacter gynuensis TaxID=1302236 RepID=A0ABP8FPL7_9SPHI